jgi:hypothetical protein
VLFLDCVLKTPLKQVNNAQPYRCLTHTISDGQTTPCRPPTESRLFVQCPPYELDYSNHGPLFHSLARLGYKYDLHGCHNGENACTT